MPAKKTTRSGPASKVVTAKYKVKKLLFFLCEFPHMSTPNTGTQIEAYKVVCEFRERVRNELHRRDLEGAL